ncbi:MAG TPA: pyridoxal-phosphate dependent enzyme [Polyangiaceae bacterium]|nr:pyridoxal-phosphate dependent enzyme [Polyangiaceae bacterium]
METKRRPAEPVISAGEGSDPKAAGPLAEFDAIPRLGLVKEPSPVTSLPGLAASLGISFLGIKRDDLSEPLHGGTKPRKLDYLLASEPFASAPVWAGAGAIGSGNLVAITAAAEELGRSVRAHLFWTPLSPGIEENLAFIASGPATITFYRSRVALALRRPTAFTGPEVDGAPVIAPGSTTAVGMIGMVRAGLELAAQVRAGELPEPDSLFIAYGSGGSAVGIALGLGLGGLKTRVVAVAAVERPLSMNRQAVSLSRALRAELERHGLRDLPEPAPMSIEHGYLGRGYAIPTKDSLAACEALAKEGIRIEPAYTGKAMAALFNYARGDEAIANSKSDKNILFWLTARRERPPPDESWRDKLPPDLARRLREARAPAPRITRRRAIIAISAAALGVGIGVRISGYPPLAAFRGAVLSNWEAHVLESAAAALLPPAPMDAAPAGSLASRIDRYLTGMPAGTLREVHAMLGLIEHGTTPLGGGLSRLTSLSIEEREAFLSDLARRGGLLATAYAGLRDLCMLGYYQSPSTWAAMGYEGPRVPLAYDPAGPERMSWPAYDALVAPKGALPKSASAVR